MGCIPGQAPLTLDGPANSLEQLILGFQQGLQLTGQRAHVQGFQRIGAASAQGITHAVERRQALADTQPKQAEAAQQRHQHWCRGRQQDRTVERFTLANAVGGGNAYLTAGQGETAPMITIDDLIMETTALVVKGLLGRVVATRKDLAPQRANLARHAVGNAQLVGTQARTFTLACQRLGQLVDQAGNHARRSHKALIQGKHHLVAQVTQHPGRRQGPDHHECRAQDQAQAQAQAHHPCSPGRVAAPRR
ncbi:hypothetical protein D3C80_1223880 [compost metagenome]